MDIKTIADNYAAEHTSEILQITIASAFADGYKQGYQDGLDARPLEDCQSPKAPNFIDLGLPSGTLWADDFLRDNEGNIKFLTYDEASLYEIPTLNQWDELIRCTRSSYKTDSDNYNSLEYVTFLGTNGKKMLLLRPAGGKEDCLTSSDRIIFVLKEVNENFEAKTDLIRCWGRNDLRKHTIDQFKGYRFPVLLVKAPCK